MIVFKEEQITAAQIDNNKNNDLDFQFYTIVNNLSAVEHLPKGFLEKFFDAIKNFFRGTK